MAENKKLGLDKLLGLFVLLILLYIVLAKFGHINGCSVPVIGQLYRDTLVSAPKVLIISEESTFTSPLRVAEMIQSELYLKVLQLSPADLSYSALDYDIIIVYGAEKLSNNLLVALKDFLARGGKLIWVYTSGVFDEEGNFASWDRPGGEDMPQINFEKVLGVSYADVPVVTSTEKVTMGQIIEKIKNMISTLKTSDALSGTTDEEITKEDYDKEWAKISALVSSYGYTSKLKSNLKNNTAYVLSFRREGTYFEVSAKEASTGVMASGQENCTFHFDIDGHPFRGRLLQDFALTDTPFLKVDLDIYTTKVASVRCRSKAYPAVTEWKYGGGKVVYVSFPPEKQESTIVMLKEIINTLSC